MVSLRKNGMKGSTHALKNPKTSTVSFEPEDRTKLEARLSTRNVLSAAIAEHFNRTHPRGDVNMHNIAETMEEDVPKWVRHPLFKGLVVTSLILGALSPVFLKVGRAESEQRRRRFHNDSFKKSNPRVSELGEYEQTNYYCHAPFPGALDSLAYSAPHGSELRAIQIITRNGDRAPCGVLPYENNVRWDCDRPDVYDRSGTPIEVSRVRDEPESLPSKLWKGNCWRCDLTDRGIKQQHMLGRALGDIYGQRLEMSPSNLYVRCVDSDANRRGVHGIVRGLLTNAIEEGPVHVESGLSRREDVLLPRLEACPRLLQLWMSMRSDPEWKAFTERNQAVMDEIVRITSLDPLAKDVSGSGGDNLRANSSASSWWTMTSNVTEKSKGFGKDDPEVMKEMTGMGLPSAWADRFDLFLDTVRARTCNNMTLPCSMNNASNCVTEEQAQRLFAAGDWSFQHRYTFKRAATARLFAGPLLKLLLQNLSHFTGDKPTKAKAESQALQSRKSVQVYSGEVDTVGGILAALNVTDWTWPPYASNVVIELWKRTETEPVPRVEGGQVEDELFVRMLYNGRIVRPDFCQRDECPLRVYKSHVLQFLVPENLQAECKAKRNRFLHHTSVPTPMRGSGHSHRRLKAKGKQGRLVFGPKDSPETAASGVDDNGLLGKARQGSGDALGKKQTKPGGVRMVGAKDGRIGRRTDEISGDSRSENDGGSFARRSDR